jgi:hypothetical protein
MAELTAEQYAVTSSIYGALLILAIAAYISNLHSERWRFILNSQAFISLFMFSFLGR